MESILDTLKETGMLSKMGGGTAGYFGNIRPKNSPLSTGGVTHGPVAFLQLFDAVTRVISQSTVRKGSFAAYLPIDHPDIMDFLLIKERGFVIQDLNFGVTVTDAWMQEMIDGDDAKRAVWARVLESRKEKGMPYIIFIDKVNNNAPDVYRDKGIKITHSNLCSEIMLQTAPDKTFVCCLTAMNLEKYDEWKDTEAVKYCTYFLDAIMQDFINKSQHISGLERAYNFAKDERALGLGATGWHSLLKKRSIPFDSLEARYLTVEVFGLLQSESIEASKQLAKWYGEPPLLEGYGRRNSTLLAIAPNTSSGTIIGTSQSIEPERSCYFTKELAWGIVPGNKCKYLKALLQEKGLDTEEIWQSILEKNGSVQHLDCLSKKEKAVFKTFWEVDQYELLRQAGIRQEYIDQGQSLNIFVPPGTSARDINNLHIHAWKVGVKALYYQRSEHVNLWKGMPIRDGSNSLPANEGTENICSACDG
jgi:ribonucleoside-diphosphate reductase alpha chain